MKDPKKHHHVIALASLALGVIIPVSLGGEKDKSNQSSTVIAAQEDPVHARLNRDIVTPLNQQADRYSKFSRRMPTSSTQYHLVEAESAKTGERSFQVMQTETPLRKGVKPTTKEYLKVRYLENTSEVVVGLKDGWVKIEEHPVLRHLPREKVGPKITP